MAKPIIKVYLLPAEWNEAGFQAFHSALVQAAVSIPDFEVENENDLITLFPKDCMEKGLGTEILIEVDVPDGPHVTPVFEQLVAVSIGSAAQQYLPRAYIQCKVYKFNPHQGCWTGRTVA